MPNSENTPKNGDNAEKETPQDTTTIHDNQEQSDQEYLKSLITSEDTTVSDSPNYEELFNKISEDNKKLSHKITLLEDAYKKAVLGNSTPADNNPETLSMDDIIKQTLGNNYR